MKRQFIMLCLGLCLMPLAAPAGSATLPIGADTHWYVHANLLEMRQTAAGQQLYEWVRREVIDDIEEEFDINLGGELDGVTVFGGAQGRQSGAVVLHGFLSAATRNAVLDRIRQEGQLEADKAHGQSYYRIAPPRVDASDGFYLAFGDMGQSLITENRRLLDEFLSAGAHFEGHAPHELLVIEADNPLVQGGLDAMNVDADGGPWESHLFQNVDQLALVIADDNGLLAVRARITAVTPDKALAIGNIVQGVVSLKAMSDEAPEAAVLLSRLKMETDDRTVHLSLAIEPEMVVQLLD